MIYSFLYIYIGGILSRYRPTAANFSGFKKEGLTFSGRLGQTHAGARVDPVRCDASEHTHKEFLKHHSKRD